MNTCSSEGVLRPGLQQGYCLRQTGADDVDAHAQNLSLWEQHYDQLAPGRFAGSLQEFWTPEAQVFLERTSHAVRQRCCVWDDALWFGIPCRHDGTRIDGREAPAHALLVQSGGKDFELLTPSQHEIFGIVIRREALVQYCETLGCRPDWQRLAATTWLQTDPIRFSHGVQWLHSLFRSLDQDNDIPAHAAAQRALNEDLMALILPFMDAAATAPPPPRAFGRRQRVVAGIEAYARSHPDWVPSVPELCARFHLSRRSLQYAFEEVLGISPVSYLRSLRLNGLRRSLRDRDSGFDTVQAAAAAWGFWQLGQLGQDYRQLFGERPSETLRHTHSTPH